MAPRSGRKSTSRCRTPSFARTAAFQELQRETELLRNEKDRQKAVNQRLQENEALRPNERRRPYVELSKEQDEGCFFFFPSERCTVWRQRPFRVFFSVSQREKATLRKEGLMIARRREECVSHSRCDRSGELGRNKRSGR